MKILFDGQIFSLQGARGISRYFYELYNGVSKTFHTEITLGSGNNSFLNSLGGKSQSNFKFFNIISYYFSHLKNELFNSYDIIHRTYFLPPLVPKKTTEVVTIFDMNHELFPDLYGPLSFLVSFFKKKACLRSDKIICISNSTKRDLINLFNIDPSKISVVYLGVDQLWSVSKDSNNIIPIIDFPFILYVGPRSNHKNFIRFYEAYSKSECFSFLKILCVGGGNLTSEELSYNHVHHLTANDEQLAYLYNNCSFFCYPSTYEGFGLPVIEAMHFGALVVGSNNSSVGEILNGNGITFDPYSVDSIKESLNLAFQYVNENRNPFDSFTYSNNFTWDKCIFNTIEVYK